MSRVVMMAALAIALATASAGCAPAGLAQAPAEPPDGTIYAGATVRLSSNGFGQFTQTSGQGKVAILNRYTTAGLTRFRDALDDIRGRPVVGMISWRLFRARHSTRHAGGTQASIARGDVDRYILGRAAEARRYAKPLFLRLNWEMNGDWMPFSRLDSEGRARRGNGYAHFRNAWRRTVILFRGGTRKEINAKLRRLRLPGLRARIAKVAPTPNVAWVWTPASKAPWPQENVHRYYPGDTYVDWVGVDWYGTSGEGAHGKRAAGVRGPNEIYDRYSGPQSRGRKPFLIGEWGVFGQDRPEWVADMFDWIEARSEVKAALYFNVRASDQNSQLQDFPASAQVYRERIVSPRWVKDYRAVEGRLVVPKALETLARALGGGIPGP
jgi:hypothetical protein